MLLLSFTEYDCLDGYMKCNDGLACFEKQSLCDGWPQCRDFSDEDKERCADLNKCVHPVVTASKV
jgi:hypothetical protein